MGQDLLYLEMNGSINSKAQYLTLRKKRRLCNFKQPYGFCDGRKSTTLKSTIIPAVIGNQSTYTITDFAVGDILLLLSKVSMEMLENTPTKVRI